MRATIAVSFLLSASLAFAQTPAPAPKPAAPAPKPAAPAPAPRRPAAPAASRAGIAMTVTSPQGMTLPGISVEVLGASDRSGETNSNGQLSFPGMLAGTYRLRFSGERVITFEKEALVRAGQTTTLDITLNAAPPPPEPPAPPPAPAPVVAPAPVGPAGEPRSLRFLRD